MALQCLCAQLSGVPHLPMSLSTHWHERQTPAGCGTAAAAAPGMCQNKHTSLHWSHAAHEGWTAVIRHEDGELASAWSCHAFCSIPGVHRPQLAANAAGHSRGQSISSRRPLQQIQTLTQHALMGKGHLASSSEVAAGIHGTRQLQQMEMVLQKQSKACRQRRPRLMMAASMQLGRALSVSAPDRCTSDCWTTERMMQTAAARVFPLDRAFAESHWPIPYSL